MRQLSKEQAIKMYKSKAWENWTDERIVRFQLFQDKLCIDFSKFHKAISKVLKRDVYTHEFAYPDELRKEYLAAKNAPTIDEIINLIPEERRLIIIP